MGFSGCTPEQFNAPFDENTKFRMGGFGHPVVDDILKGEFKKSWMWFKFIEVDQMRDPPDQFFADVVPIEQEMKYG